MCSVWKRGNIWHYLGWRIASCCKTKAGHDRRRQSTAAARCRVSLSHFLLRMQVHSLAASDRPTGPNKHWIAPVTRHKVSSTVPAEPGGYSEQPVKMIRLTFEMRHKSSGDNVRGEIITEIWQDMWLSVAKSMRTIVLERMVELQKNVPKSDSPLNQ